MVSAQTEEKRTRVISLRIKLLIGFTVVFSAVFIGTYYWFYSYATDKAMQRIQEDLVDTLKGAIAGTNGDDFAQLAEMPIAAEQQVPADDPLYQAHQQWLETVHTIEPRATPYTFVPGDIQYQVLWIGDLFRITNPDKETTFKEAYNAAPDKTVLYNGLSELTITMTPQSDQWGTWVSAYAPIRDSTGQVVGGMGIDFSADYVFSVQDGIRQSIIISFAISYISLFILVYVLSGIMTRPIVGLTEVAESIGEGNYDQDLAIFKQKRWRDEINSLAEVFELMVSKVRRREETLRQQVTDLKVEIDHAKRQRQVKEVLDTSFFQDLQAKARSIRSRGREGLTDQANKSTDTQ